MHSVKYKACNIFYFSFSSVSSYSYNNSRTFHSLIIKTRLKSYTAYCNSYCNSLNTTSRKLFC